MSLEFAQKSQITALAVSKFVCQDIMKESKIEAALRLETSKLPNAGMISSSDVGAFLGFLIQTINAKRALEIGTFTGYTALKMAQALPKDGQLICCDINAEWTGIGKKYWQEAGIAEKIDLHIAPAQETLRNLIQDGQVGTFDFAFIDADKEGYESYFEASLKLLRRGGLIVFDNMLWSGRVADSNEKDPTTLILRNLDFKVKADPRVEACLLTVGDGLMLARKL